MRIYRNIIIAAVMLSGCETVYHRNTVYQYDVGTTDAISSFNKDSQSCIEGDPPYEWDALICTEYGEKEEDSPGNGIETGYCCVWLEEPPMCETPPCSIPMLCQHNLCFWESSCSWELISTTCDQ
jgi:hypothetical protein